MLIIDVAHLTLRFIDISHSKYETLKTIDIVNKELPNIDVSHNRLSDIPKEFLGSFIEIVEIDFSYNRLKKVELYSLETLPKLRLINLSNNNIIQIDKDAFSHLNQLEYLNLSSNRIAAVGEVLFRSKFNVHLHLEHNPISELECLGYALVNGFSMFISWANIEKLTFSCSVRTGSLR